MNNLQKIGGAVALLEASFYLVGFIFFGAIWDFPSEASSATKLAFLAEHHLTLSLMNLLLYVMFGALLAVLVLALHERLKGHALVLSQLAAVFGLIWVALVIASGMIANIGLDAVIELSVMDIEQAWSLWLTVGIVTEGIGGGNEIVGGIWVLLLSIAALRSAMLPKKLNCLGIFVGVTGIASVYPAEMLTVVFGLSQIIWFIWLGLAMLVRA